MFFRSNDESYIDEGEEDLLNTSYDSTNAFNVFEHEMKIKANGSAAGGESLGLSPSEIQAQNLENLKMHA